MHKKGIISLLVTGILLLIVLVSGCSSSQDSDQSSNNPPSPSQDETTFRTQEIVLYFGDDQAMYLVPEKRTIKVPETADKLPTGAIINELIEGPNDESLRPTIPKETKLLSVKIEDKTAYVDFSEEIRTKHWGGSAGETMTITSIVNSLTELDGIDKVQILIAGEKQDSLVGHWYIGDPIERMDDIIKK